MVARALLAFLLLPGHVGILGPPLIAAFDPWRGEVWIPGLAIMSLGATVLILCVRDFYRSGKGTLAPWDPPTRLVVVGLYRFVRNPMYIGVLTLVSGWAATLSSPLLAVYTGLLAVAFHVRIVGYEEPRLKSGFGEEWDEYRAAVPRWLPRLRPWEKNL